ncbi:methylated-DNA--[protein]-cysteine S-methyltransferase [Flavisolibacter tropicus]|uniref:Methylated-DNA--protein-cysteine methyltransferase n=1 Tax=Flavisolibacter tropicus TaxID=1492898 RepID=A0A172TRW9_9BACT|nr:methylated-DNA--[protein]-cysteine S-methyltransferase [Flavisolibacter tropicus]ANE49513.1 cysteine methyltransferase [Flavisolibacter tropicus]
MYTSYISSPVGNLQLQCSDEGITTVNFWEEAIATSDTHPLLKQCQQELEEYFAGQRKEFSIPLELNGTTFQTRVWTALQDIPYGKTVSYMGLSKTLGDVKAIRAVGTANGRNKIAIIIPCHRVIGSNSSLTGYAGGLWRKQWLLEHEAKFHSGVQTLPF